MLGRVKVMRRGVLYVNGMLTDDGVMVKRRGMRRGVEAVSRLHIEAASRLRRGCVEAASRCVEARAQRPASRCSMLVRVSADLVCQCLWVSSDGVFAVPVEMRSLDQCWRGCGAMCMVSTAAKPCQVVLGPVLCSLGVWGDVGRPHCVATVSQPCSCPYGVREKVLRCACPEVRKNVSGWYECFRVVLI